MRQIIAAFIQLFQISGSSFIRQDRIIDETTKLQRAVWRWSIVNFS